MSDSSSVATPLSIHHERARTRGNQAFVFWLTCLLLKPFLRLYFRISIVGREHIPKEGGVILASNHRSFLDPFVVGICLKRPIYFVAKKELFDKRLTGWFLNCLGAFPIRRGESDEESMETAKQILERGDALVIFPEGTRHRTGSLGRPKRGVGRLALETGAPVIPVAVHGTDRARRGWRIRPVKVKVRYGRPLTFPRADNPPKSLAAEVTARIWPCVELQWEWLGGLPPLRKAAVIGAGAMGTGVGALLARAGLDVQLGCRSPEHADRMRGSRVNENLPGVELPEGVVPMPASGIEFGGVDLVVFAVPAGSLPQAVGSVGARIGSRTAVLVLAKGIVPPLGMLPSRYVGDRVKARAIAALGGPFHAGEAVHAGASAVLASGGDRRAGRPVPRGRGGARWCLGGARDRGRRLRRPARRRPHPRRHRRGALARRHRRGARRLRQERRHARRRGRDGQRHERRRRRRGARVRRARADGAEARRRAGDLPRPGRRRRPDGHGAGAAQPQPPGGRAARQRRTGVRDRRAPGRYRRGRGFRAAARGAVRS